MKTVARAKKRPIAATAIMTMLVLLPLVASPGCAKEDASALNGGTFYCALSSEPLSLDPAGMQDSESVRVGKQIFDGLTGNDPETMETVPAMAESWSANSDASAWTFKLEEGVEFHNGRECKAEDFVYSWNRIVDPDTASEAAWRLSFIQGFDEVRDGTAETMSGVRAIDDYTLEVTLAFPYSQFPAIAAHPVFSPVPREEVEKYGGAGFYDHPVGTGPFSFAAWDHGKEIVIERYAGYYGDEKARLDQVVFKVFEGEEAGYREFKAEGLNEAQIPDGQYDAARVEYGERAIFEPLLSVTYIGMNMYAEPLRSNASLRQALSYAVDKDSLCDTIVQGTCGPATGIVPEGVYGYRDNVMPYEYDPPKARDLMSKAYPEGIISPAEMIIGYSDGTGSGEVVKSVQADFRDIGVDCVVESFEWNSYLEMIRDGQITFFLRSWSSDYPTMDSFLYPLFFSASAGSDNLVSYANPSVDELIMEARRTPDQDRSDELYRQAEKLIAEDSPVIPLMFSRTSRVISEDVGGYIRTALDDTPYELVYLKNSY